MLQHENRHISEMRDYFCTKRCSFVLHTTLHKYVASCCIYLMYAKLTETQVLRTNFATEQKASTVHTLLTRTPACQTTQT